MQKPLIKTWVEEWEAEKSIEKKRKKIRFQQCLAQDQHNSTWGSHTKAADKDMVKEKLKQQLVTLE